ncbi:MAG: DUF4340 domain-containing protein [Deltaproteobacteria bacterium]|nr:DUF4340 domain-containing protein [Deltaproteobacteria bacterium]
MNQKGIMIALGTLVVLGAATAVAYKPRAATDSAEEVRDPWQRLDKDRVDHVTVVRPGTTGTQATTMEFEKRDGAWRMTAPGSGPTEPNAVQELLDNLSRMHVTSVAARRAASYTDFEIDDAHAVRVTLKNGGSSLMDLYVGASVDNGTAVRVPNRPEVWRADQSIHFMVNRAPRDWRDRDITHLERARVRSVEWRNSHGTFRFERNGESWSAAAGTTVPNLDTARVGSLVDSVLNLRASDFAEASAQTGLTDTSPSVAITTDGDGGGTITLKLGGPAGENESHVRRDGSDIVYIIGRTMADSLNPQLSNFQAPPVTDAGTSDAAAAAPTPPPTPPPGGPGGPGGAQGLSPDAMEQIRRAMEQMQRNGAGGAPPPGAHP